MKQSAKKTYLRMSILIIAIFLFIGCKAEWKLQNDMKNVEQRDYATLLMISPGTEKKDYEFSLGIAEEKQVGEKSQTEQLTTISANNFDELSKEYQSVKGKSLSLVHLKVILLARKPDTVLESQGDILIQLGENEEIAKTCPVLQITKQEEFLQYVEKAQAPVGIYISNLIKRLEEQGCDVPWLKDYVKVLKEGSNLSMYVLEPALEGWQIKCRAEMIINNE